MLRHIHSTAILSAILLMLEAEATAIKVTSKTQFLDVTADPFFERPLQGCKVTYATCEADDLSIIWQAWAPNCADAQTVPMIGGGQQAFNEAWDTLKIQAGTNSIQDLDPCPNTVRWQHYGDINDQSSVGVAAYLIPNPDSPGLPGAIPRIIPQIGSTAVQVPNPFVIPISSNCWWLQPEGAPFAGTNYPSDIVCGKGYTNDVSGLE